LLGDEEIRPLPYVTLEYSPLARRSAGIHYREFGEGRPLVFLHSGWGYHAYPINKQLHELKQYRVLIPDRSGYGLSSKPAAFAADFHLRAAEETFAFMDAAGVDKAVLWGHSDGSVIAAWMGLMRPERCRGIVLEAFHYARRKVLSQEFFEQMVSRPESFGERISAILAHEHGEPYWRELLQAEGRTWLEICALAGEKGEDLYDGRFGALRPPVAVIHGAGDPRTDEGEMEAMQRALPAATIRLIGEGGHCPHGESRAAAEFTAQLMRALASFEQGE
jgi:pimeloyl-ACP methyl ester carboxylesterase